MQKMIFRVTFHIRPKSKFVPDGLSFLYLAGAIYYSVKLTYVRGVGDPIATMFSKWDIYHLSRICSTFANSTSQYCCPMLTLLSPVLTMPLPVCHVLFKLLFPATAQDIHNRNSGFINTLKVSSCLFNSCQDDIMDTVSSKLIVNDSFLARHNHQHVLVS